MQSLIDINNPPLLLPLPHLLYYNIAMATSHRHAAPVLPGWSLLRLSVAQRLAGALILSGLLWLAVFWAIR